MDTCRARDCKNQRFLNFEDCLKHCREHLDHYDKLLMNSVVLRMPHAKRARQIIVNKAAKLRSKL